MAVIALYLGETREKQCTFLKPFLVTYLYPEWNSATGIMFHCYRN